MLDNTPISAAGASRGVLTMLFMYSTPRLGSGAGCGALCTLPVTLSTRSRHKLAKKTGTSAQLRRRPPNSAADRPTPPQTAQLRRRRPPN
jgi:hypothetical protein